MSSAVPPVRPMARLVFCALGSLTAVALIVIVAVPVEVMLGRISSDQALYALAVLVQGLAPVSLVGGLLGAALGMFSRWLSATSPVGTAVTAGATAVGVGALVTFGLLWAPLDPVLQVLWILLLGAGVAWGSWLADRMR
ncbi:hypothetical protein [Nesterenkonia suensis]